MTENQNERPEQQNQSPLPPSTESTIPVAAQQGAQSGSPNSNLPAGSSPEQDSQHQPSNMEVHHAHHPSHKKKWTEYLLEFFMLFLAVFLGFLVENYREHQVELHRTEKHMHTMVENLKYDTTRFARTFRANLMSARDLDSFRWEVSEMIAGKTNANRLYCLRFGMTSNSAATNSSAMTQLKSSGMLRMIKDELVSEMGDYYERYYNGLETGKEVMEKRRDQLNETMRSVFTYQGFEEFLQWDTISTVNGPNPYIQKYWLNVLTRNPPLKLLPTATANLHRLYDDLAAYKLSVRGYNGRLRSCHQQADSLMKHIKEEYGFD